jgi:regulator of sigma D
MKRMQKKYQKTLISDFSSGNLEGVISAHENLGDDVFDYVPIDGRSYFHRLIVYSIRNSHFNIIEYYLENSKTHTLLSLSELNKIASKISSKKERIEEFLKICDNNKKVSEFLKFDYTYKCIVQDIVQHYDYELIDWFIKEYPNELESMIKMCSTTKLGTQLKRHLIISKVI